MEMILSNFLGGMTVSMGLDQFQTVAIQTLQINLQAIKYVEQKHLVLLQAQRKKKRNKIHPASHQKHSIRNTLFIAGFL